MSKIIVFTFLLGAVCFTMGKEPEDLLDAIGSIISDVKSHSHGLRPKDGDPLLSSRNSTLQCEKNIFITIFANRVMDKIKGNDTLAIAYDLRPHDRRSLRNFFYAFVLESFKSINAKDSRKSALGVGRAVWYNFPKAKPDSLLSILVYAAGRYLFLRGFLGPANAAVTLVEKYVTIAGKEITSIRCPTRLAYFKAVWTTFVEFLQDTGFFNDHSTLMIAGELISQWFAL